MCWCALMEAPFVLAAATSSSMAETARKFLPAMRAQLVVLYFSAAFWKLTSSWCEMQTRCRRDADEMQPRCSRDAVELQPKGVAWLAAQAEAVTQRLRARHHRRRRLLVGTRG